MANEHIDDEVEKTARVILTATREELTRADGKAALLLGALGVTVGTTVAALMAGNWSPQKLNVDVRFFWWAGALIGIAGIISLSYSVYPRTKYRSENPPAVLSFFGHIVRIPREELAKKLADSVKHNGSASLDQLKQISMIVDKKYRGIQIGMWCVGIGTLCCGISVVASNFLN